MTTFQRLHKRSATKIPVAFRSNFGDMPECAPLNIELSITRQIAILTALADASLTYSIMGFNPKSIAAMLENIVYFELRRRGYEVYIGKSETKEIDFVAVRRDERIYIQVCRQLPEKSDREIANLLEIKDHYPKYVVTLDELAAGNVDGVKLVHLADFLLSHEY